MPVTFLFPGQGSESPGMLAHLPAAPVIEQTLYTAEKVLRVAVRALDSESALHRTENAQLALLISSVASARWLVESEVKPHFVAGHSVGAFAAAVIAGVLPFEDALELVTERGAAMVRAAPTESGMAVLAGAPLPLLERLLSEANVPSGSIYIANRNSCDQIVIAGKCLEIENILKKARERGLRRAQMLSVPVPSHTPWMLPVAEKLSSLVKRIKCSPPAVPFGSNISGRLLFKSEEIVQDLIWGVARPVNWVDCLSALYEAGTRIFLEMPPGNVLTRIASARFPDVRAYSLEDSSVASLVKAAGLA